MTKHPLRLPSKNVALPADVIGFQCPCCRRMIASESSRAYARRARGSALVDSLPALPAELAPQSVCHFGANVEEASREEEGTGFFGRRSKQKVSSPSTCLW